MLLRKFATGCVAAARKGALWENALSSKCAPKCISTAATSGAVAGRMTACYTDKNGTFSAVTTVIRRVSSSSAKSAFNIDPEALRKARRMSTPVGVVAGLFGSLVGVGGGVVIVPMIVSACKTIPQRLVSGTSLAAVLSTALVSASTFAQSGCVDPTVALIVSPMAMLTAPLGARLTARLNCAALRRTLGIFLICAAPLVPIKAYLMSGKQRGRAEIASLVSSPNVDGDLRSAGQDSSLLETIVMFIEHEFSAISALPLSTTVPLAATGVIAGLASGLLGIGGGTIVTPLLSLLMPYGHATVLGTSLAAMVPPSIAALAQHTRLGNVDWRMAAGLAAGTAVGGVLGSNMAVQAPLGVLEACFAVGMLFLGKRTLQSAR